MLFDLAPTMTMLGLLAWFIIQHRGRPLIQVYSLIVASYLNIFPTIDFLLVDGQGMDGFIYYQCLIITFFQLPLLGVMHLSVAGVRRFSAASEPAPARLSAWLPWFLGALLFVFWFVVFHYGLFFRRIGHESLQLTTANVPISLLYFYRIAVETSFFVIVYLWTTLSCVANESRYLLLYRSVLAAYLITFIFYFAINSRMQLILMVLCMICSQPRIAELFLKGRRLLLFGVFLVFFLLGITLFRELLLEGNGRISTDTLSDMLLDAMRLIAGRLNSIVILYELHEFGLDPWGFELSGMSHLLNFYLSFFIDRATFDAIKESLVTSPSVEIVNRLLSDQQVDFPKSMILDMFLSFGVYGLLLTSVIIGNTVGWVQRQMATFRGFTPFFLLSLFALPMLLEFEKEFMGTFFAFLKWSPMLILLYWWRPRFDPGQGFGTNLKQGKTTQIGAVD